VPAGRSGLDVSRRVGILGGSFDPVHHGHLIAARALLEALALDEVRLIPAGTQPFKAGRHGAPADARALMAMLAVEGEPGLEVDRIEVDRDGPSYTADTLRSLHSRWPGASLVLCLGSDAAAEFGGWREAAAIPSLAEVVVFPRGGGVPPVLAHARLVPVPRVEISATIIRDRVRAGRSIRYLVPDQVAGYIADRGLYRGDGG
jgi:nicotinate-nucleotide adenylyltransferase